MSGSKLGKKVEVRVFLDPTIVEKVDEYVEKGKFGSSRSEVIRQLLRDWVRGVLK